MNLREELHWLLTDRSAARWWFNRLVIQRFNGERKSARRYQQMLDGSRRTRKDRK